MFDPSIEILTSIIEFAIELVMLTISSTADPFSFCLQSFPALGSLPMNQLFAAGGESIGALSSVLPVNIQDWFPFVLTGLISLQSKELSSVFSSTTLQKYQFFDAWPSLWPNSHMRTCLLAKPCCYCLVSKSYLTLRDPIDCSQTPLPRQEYWSGLSFPSPDLPNPGFKPSSPAWLVDSLP